MKNRKKKNNPFCMQNSKNLIKLDSNTDNSTCCDEDFTWVCNDEKNATSNAYKSNVPTTVKNTSHGIGADVDVKNNNGNVNSKRTRQLRPSSSLDRRRLHSRNRQERDSKSRSAHSLHESSATSTTDYASPEYSSGIVCFLF